MLVLDENAAAPPAEALTPAPDQPGVLIDACDHEPFRWAFLGGLSQFA